ncbi:MAG: hypothetical protein L0Y71_07430 [Gemmataceae bacterium]|nr:hypothetical protein [Gemmataceae bacterium]
MLHYFYLLNQAWLEEALRPALTESWRRRSFQPCRTLCRTLLETEAAGAAPVVAGVARGLPFDRTFWQALVGECLILGADAMPRLEIAFESLCCFLAPDRLGAEVADRGAFSPIEQAYFGSRDLRFGGRWHQPEYVGWNDAGDIARLVSYLQSVDPGAWSAAALQGLSHFENETERDEELADARAWWPALVEMYAGAQAAGQVIVAERV